MILEHKLIAAYKAMEMRYKPLGDTSKQRADCKKVSFVTQAIVICTVIVL